MKKNVFFVGLLLLLIPLWVFSISPQLLKIPEDFNYSVDIFSQDNFFDEKEGDFSGEVESSTNFLYVVDEVKEGILIVKSIFDVRKPSGEKIIAVERHYGIDPNTGKHKAGFGDRDRDGYLFGPKNLKRGQDFTYWHVNYDTPVLMKFQDEENILGLNAYRYEANYKADQTENLRHLPEVGKSRGVNLDVNLVLWIEPVTGMMIKYEDKTTGYYYDLITQARISPWNKFSNKFTFSSVAMQVNLAQNARLKAILVQTVIPVVFGMLALILTIVTFSTKASSKFTIPIIILIIGLLITFGLWSIIKNRVESEQKLEFDRQVDLVYGLLQNRLLAYKAALRGAGGLFESSVEVESEEWKSYVKAIRIEQNYPGIAALSYDVYLDKNGVIQVPVTYVEPLDEKNKLALGYDAFSEPRRREALIKARDTGQITVSKKVSLIQDSNDENKQAGFIMFLPLSREGTGVYGFVSAPFRMNNFMKGVLGNSILGVSLEIYDTDESLVINESDKMFEYGENIVDPKYLTVKQLEVANHHWNLVFASSPITPVNQSRLSLLIFGVGVLFSLTLSALSYVLLSSESKAVKLADEMTAKSKAAIAELTAKTGELEKINKLMVGRELKMIELKDEIKKLSGN